MAERYISVSGLDSNDGSHDAPWKSLAHALTGSRLKRGDTLVFLSDVAFGDTYTQMAIGPGAGDGVTLDLGTHALKTSASTPHLLRPFAGKIFIKNGKIDILHEISLGIFRGYVSSDITFDDVELQGNGKLGGLIYENNTSVDTVLNLKDVRFDKPGRLLYIGTKTGGSISIHFDNAIIKNCMKIWTGAGVFNVRVTSSRRSVFHGFADMSISGGLLSIPNNASVADKSQWDIRLSGNVFLQGNGVDSGSSIIYAADAASGRGSWMDIFEANFKDNILYNYHADNYDTNNAAANFYARAFNGVTDMFDIDPSNIWRPPYPAEPKKWADYETIQSWTAPAPSDAAILGDSVAWGQGSDLAQKGCAYHLAQLFSGTVVDKSQAGMPGLGIHGLRTWADRMMCKHPARYVLVLVGVNNIKSGGTYNAVPDVGLARHAEHAMRAIEARGGVPIWIGCGAAEGGGHYTR